MKGDSKTLTMRSNYPIGSCNYEYHACGNCKSAKRASVERKSDSVAAPSLYS